MEFVIFNYLFVMLLTENALLDMFGHRGFQTFPIVLAPQKRHRFEVFHYGLNPSCSNCNAGSVRV